MKCPEKANFQKQKHSGCWGQEWEQEIVYGHKKTFWSDQSVLKLDRGYDSTIKCLLNITYILNE